MFEFLSSWLAGKKANASPDSSSEFCASPVTEPAVCEPPKFPLFPSNVCGPAAASGSPYAGMYDDAGETKSSPPSVGMTPVADGAPLDYSPANPTAEQLAEIKEAEKQANIKRIQADIDAAKALEAEATKLEKSGDVAGAAAKRASAAGKKQSAIDLSITTYDIDVSNAESVKYDASTSGEGETRPNNAGDKGIVTIGDDAFANAAWLASTIGHESEVHINRQLMKGNWYSGAVGTDLQEVETYQYEIDSAARYGTSEEQVKDLKARRKTHYDALPKEYQERAGKKDYTMKAGEENL